jgi:hypothetical protein
MLLGFTLGPQYTDVPFDCGAKVKHGRNGVDPEVPPVC